MKIFTVKIAKTDKIQKFNEVPSNPDPFRTHTYLELKRFEMFIYPVNVFVFFTLPVLLLNCFRYKIICYDP